MWQSLWSSLWVFLVYWIYYFTSFTKLKKFSATISSNIFLVLCDFLLFWHFSDTHFFKNRFFLLFYLFMRDTERGRQRHRQREKQASHREPNVGLDPWTQDHALSQRATQLLSHLGISKWYTFFCFYFCLISSKDILSKKFFLINFFWINSIDLSLASLILLSPLYHWAHQWIFFSYFILQSYNLFAKLFYFSEF